MEFHLITNKTDLKKGYELRQTIFVIEQNCPPEEEFDHLENICDHFILKIEGTPVGAARFRDYNGVAKFERICVLKEYRKTGAGRVIMTGLENHAKEKGYTSSFLNAQVQAIPFYEKLGYVICSEQFMDAGIPHHSMKKIF